MKIHGHPQKTDYKADGSDWPIITKQGHWPGADPTMTTHIHVDVQFPYGAEIATEKFVCPFTLKAFMLNGKIGLFTGDQFDSIHWDATNSSIPPSMIGDPNSMIPKVWTGKVTIDPQKSRFAHKHGWTNVFFNAIANFTNGDKLAVQHVNSFFSIADITQPEVAPPGNFGPILSSRVDTNHANEQSKFGTMICEIDDWVPLLPINQPWKTIINFYNYTAPPESGSMPNGRFEQRTDPDLHNGVRGILTDSADCDKNGISNRTIVFDPKIIGNGKHKIVEFWTQQNATDHVSALVGIDVEVSGGGGTTITVPDLKNKTKDGANSALMSVGLLLGTSMEMNDQTIPKGNVISQFPNAGTTVIEGSTINITLSSGPVVSPNETWVPAVPTFMQLHINGVPQKRWQICGIDNSQTMDDCVEIVVKVE